MVLVMESFAILTPPAMKLLSVITGSAHAIKVSQEMERTVMVSSRNVKNKAVKYNTK